MMEISDCLWDYGINRPDIQAMLDLAATVVYEKPGMSGPAKIDEAARRMFIMAECGFRRQQDAGLSVDKQYFEWLYKELESSGWDITIGGRNT